VSPGTSAPATGYREACVGSYASSNARVQGYIARHTWVPERRRLKRLYLSMEEDPRTSLERSLEFKAHVVSASGSYANDMAAVLSREGARNLGISFVVASEAITTESRNFLVERCGSRLVSIYGAWRH